MLRLASLAWPIGPVAALEDWLGTIDRAIGRLDAQMILLPEYAGLALAAGARADVAEELQRALAQAEAMLAGLAALARSRGVWLQPGTLPVRVGDRIFNRAPLIAPDGRMVFQDKYVMTRFEREDWGIDGGAAPKVFATPFGLIGISICYDVEFPNLVRAQTSAGAKLILVPSCTDTPAGAARITLSARARAIENQCFVAVSPTVGEAPWLGTLDVNRGVAGIYAPCDRGFPDDGVMAQSVADQPGAAVADLDFAAIERVRQEGAQRNFAHWVDRVEPAQILAF